MNNLYTGDLIYNTQYASPIKFDSDVTVMGIFVNVSKYWMTAACSDGRVAFISRPKSKKGVNFIEIEKIIEKEKHRQDNQDVVSLAINNDNVLVTASLDNFLCIWNSNTGDISKTI